MGEDFPLEVGDGGNSLEELGDCVRVFELALTAGDDDLLDMFAGDWDLLKVDVALDPVLDECFFSFFTFSVC